LVALANFMPLSFRSTTGVADPQRDETGLSGDLSQRRSRVPHISRFFREMWEIVALSPKLSTNLKDLVG
jgi:hypothetical protein